MSRRCDSCGSPYHEATGHIFSEKTVVCGPCARHFVQFIKSHTRRKWGGLNFYEHAASSIKPEKE